MGLQSGELRVSAVSVEVTRKRVDQTMSTVSDSVEVDAGDVSHRDSWAWSRSRSDLPLRGGGGVRLVWIVLLV